MYCYEIPVIFNLKPERHRIKTRVINDFDLTRCLLICRRNLGLRKVRNSG